MQYTLSQVVCQLYTLRKEVSLAYKFCSHTNLKFMHDIN